MQGGNPHLTRLMRAALFFLWLCVAAVAFPGAVLADTKDIVAANQGLSTCSRLAGKPLYDCVAGVLDRLAADIAPYGNSETQRSLQTAAAGLRAATNKAAALSAIAICRSAIAAALKQSRAMGGSNFRGWGRAEGLAGIASVLARAAQLIQSKG